MLPVLHEPRVSRQDWRAARGDKTQLMLAAARENIGTRRGRRGKGAGLPMLRSSDGDGARTWRVMRGEERATF